MGHKKYMPWPILGQPRLWESSPYLKRSKKEKLSLALFLPREAKMLGKNLPLRHSFHPAASIIGL